MTNHIGENCVVQNHPEARLNGYHGIARALDALGQSYAVEFPASVSDFPYLHSCHWACAEARGYFISKEFLRFKSDPARAESIGQFLSKLRTSALVKADAQ